MILFYYKTWHENNMKNCFRCKFIQYLEDISKAKRSKIKSFFFEFWQWQSKYLIPSSFTSFSPGNLHTMLNYSDIPLFVIVLIDSKKTAVYVHGLLCNRSMFNENQQSKCCVNSRISISFSQWPCLLLMVKAAKVSLYLDLFWF